MINELKYVEAVCQNGSFSKAARTLYISQPALSIAISKLEKELGTPLFDRSTSPVRPTDACQYYLDKMHRIAAIEEEVKNHFSNEDAGEHGTISIGSTSYYCCRTLPLLLHAFRQIHPGITGTLHEETSADELAARLRNGEFDLVLSSNPHGMENMQKQRIEKEYLIAVIPAEWPINEKYKGQSFTAAEILAGKHRHSDKAPLHLKDLETMPYISLQRESDLYGRALSLFHMENAEPTFAMYVDQMTTAYFMTLYGYGFSIIRDGTLHIVPEVSPDEKPSVCFYRLDSPLAIRDICFYYRNTDYLSPALSTFIHYTENQQID